MMINIIVKITLILIQQIKEDFWQPTKKKNDVSQTQSSSQ